MITADELTLPEWACVSPRRKEHIARVTTLILSWAEQMRLTTEERNCWFDAARWHDALRDAPEGALRELVHDDKMPAPLLHGPAAAVRLARDGEARQDVLDAIRYHTVGWPQWGRTGKALYMADYLEPGREFMGAERAQLAAQVSKAFDATFREVVIQRAQWTRKKGREPFPESTALLRAVSTDGEHGS
jgi:HD superfamily phosphohydrolase YqeK